MTTDTCYLCQGPGPLRRVPVEVRGLSVSGSFVGPHGHAHVTELQPLCEACIARRDAAGKTLLAASGGLMALMGVGFVLPLLLCLGGGAGLALFLWLRP